MGGRIRGCMTVAGRLGAWLGAWLAAGLLLVTAGAGASEIPFGDYRLLRQGMNEGEVLVRVGPPDFVSLTGAPEDFPRRHWFYLPEPGRSWAWMTELTFDHHGRVVRIDRQRVR